MIQKQGSSFEFITLMASLMAVVALAIDALLPALDIIGLSINTASLVENQLIVTMIFLGLGIGPLVFGPISDSLGRKPVVYFGFFIFLIASFICVYSEDLTWMLIGRVFQGIDQHNLPFDILDHSEQKMNPTLLIEMRSMRCKKIFKNLRRLVALT